MIEKTQEDQKIQMKHIAAKQTKPKSNESFEIEKTNIISQISYYYKSQLQWECNST